MNEQQRNRHWERHKPALFGFLLVVVGFIGGYFSPPPGELQLATQSPRRVLFTTSSSL